MLKAVEELMPMTRQPNELRVHNDLLFDTFHENMTRRISMEGSHLFCIRDACVFLSLSCEHLLMLLRNSSNVLKSATVSTSDGFPYV